MSANPSEMCLLSRGVIQGIARQRDGEQRHRGWGAPCVCVRVCVYMCAHASTCTNEHVCPHSTNMVEMGGRLDLCPGVTVIDHKQLEWMENQV